MSTASASIVVDGKLAKEPDLKFLPSGSPVCSFSIPVDSGWGDRKVTTWYNISVFGKRAEQCAENLRKGSRVSVSGEPHLEVYEKRDGGQGFSLKVSADRVTFLEEFGKKAERSETEDKQVAQENADDVAF